MAVTSTGLLIASLVASAVSATVAGVASYQSAKAQSKALAREGTLKAKERDQRTRLLASKQRSSFATSGIVLSGDESSTVGAMQAETYQDGIEDVNLIKSNYNNAIKDKMAKGRMDLITGIVAGVSTAMKAGSTTNLGQAETASQGGLIGRADNATGFGDGWNMTATGTSGMGSITGSVA